jgi:hypothetical protein
MTNENVVFPIRIRIHVFYLNFNSIMGKKFSIKYFAWGEVQARFSDSTKTAMTVSVPANRPDSKGHVLWRGSGTA